MKPPKCCHPDCENCPYVDCNWGGYSRYDDIVTDAIEKELQIESMDYDKRHSKEIQDRYNHSEKGQQTARTYRNTINYAESQKRYRSTEKAKRKACERSKRAYEKKSKEIGRPYTTVRDNKRKYGIDMGKGEFIRSISTNGRLSIPKQFLEQLGYDTGTEVAMYIDNQGKLVIISVDKARKETEKMQKNAKKLPKKFSE